MVGSVTYREKGFSIHHGLDQFRSIDERVNIMEDAERLDTLLEMLLETLQLLAADYDTQKNTFPDFVVVPDEIALTFDEAYGWVPEMVDKGIVNKEQELGLVKLNGMLNIIGSKGLWTEDCLKSALEWENLRVLASDAIASFCKKKEKPNLSWIMYIPGK